MKSDPYVRSHLRKKFFLLVIHCDTGRKRYGEQSEEPVRVLDTDDCSHLSETRVFEEAVLAHTCLVYDHDLLLSKERILDAGGMIAT
ncbi:MAG: hypothetical protein C5S52_08500 [ANME-2 cluster archaeon]|nr:hypothetical protein [ANME-2 cluster archaeon]